MKPNDHVQRHERPSEGPPPAPETPRRFNFYLYQLIALPIIILIPILTVLGLFGDRSDTVVIEKEGVVFTVEFASLSRTQVFQQLRVSARNGSGSVLPNAVLELDRAYLDRMSQLTSNPAIETATGGVYIVELGDIAPGETSAAVFDYFVNHVGTVNGQIRLLSGETVVTETTLSTFVFP